MRPERDTRVETLIEGDQVFYKSDWYDVQHVQVGPSQVYVMFTDGTIVAYQPGFFVAADLAPRSVA